MKTVILSELVQYVVPRFSLKTRIRFDRVESAGDIQLVTDRPETGVEVLKLVSGETVYVTAVGGVVESSDYQAFVDWLVSEPGGQQLLTLSWMVSRSRFQRPPKKLLRLRWSLSEILRMAESCRMTIVAVVIKLIVPISTRALITRPRSTQCVRSMIGIFGFRRSTLCRHTRR